MGNNSIKIHDILIYFFHFLTQAMHISGGMMIKYFSTEF